MNTSPNSYRRELCVKDCCFYEKIVFECGKNSICNISFLYQCILNVFYWEIDLQSAFIHSPHDGHLDFSLHVQKIQQPMSNLIWKQKCIEYHLPYYEIPQLSSNGRIHNFEKARSCVAFAFDNLLFRNSSKAMIYDNGLHQIAMNYLFNDFPIYRRQLK